MPNARSYAGQQKGGWQLLPRMCSLFSGLVLQKLRIVSYPVQGPGQQCSALLSLAFLPELSFHPLIIPGGLVLCSWIKPGQLSLKPPSHVARPLLRSHRGERDVFHVPGHGCAKHCAENVKTKKNYCSHRGAAVEGKGSRQSTVSFPPDGGFFSLKGTPGW